ncbi:hypothetical protein CkaCkLH20_06679 [Colletotrichum karsti]|uniref:Tat pathway signal sequence n=1 Tax=Colletotrichum karsti TaxID=1095194 RepID=A0A9P6LKM7_9PEZI|nr:uncharacterized protein CkaCkLH20_06679 [Colletotrichum karsti]KAF9875747.1 hypothetical protein CkaCkLH20_06679 [Colletotrichum karsti]
MPKSPLSPSAMMLAGRMPVIAEDDSLPAVVHPSDAPGLPPPPPPSRTTKPKTWARSPISRPIYPYPSYPPPAYNPSSHSSHARNLSRSSSRSSSRSTVSTRSLMSSSSRSRGSPPGSRPGSGTSTPRSSYYKAGARHSGLVPITTPVGPVEDDKSGEKAKEARRRRRRWYTIVGMIVVIGLVVGLAVGFTTGTHKQNPTTPQLPPNLPSIFPAGSFAFTTALTSAPTNCTSNPSTWRCFPYTTYAQSSAGGGSPNASLATFFWTIAPRNSYTYQVSSSPNPFAPQFANLTTTLLDGNSYNERLVFNFSLPKTVVPSAAIAADDRAASCVWAGTAFSATLWTRRSASVGGGAAAAAKEGNATLVSDGSKWADWPGQVEVVQVASGGPECKDSEGAAVPVAAGDGECECHYANFGLGG